MNSKTRFCTLTGNLDYTLKLTTCTSISPFPSLALSVVSQAVHTILIPPPLTRLILVILNVLHQGYSTAHVLLHHNARAPTVAAAAVACNLNKVVDATRVA